MILDAGVAASARLRDPRVIDAARNISVGFDVVFTMTVGAPGRDDEARLLLRVRVDTVVVFRRDLVVASRTRDLRQLVGVRELFQRREISMAVDARHRAVRRCVEQLVVNGNRAAVVALGRRVAMAGQTVVVGWRLWNRLTGGRRPGEEPGGRDETTETDPHDGLPMSPWRLFLQRS